MDLKALWEVLGPLWLVVMMIAFVIVIAWVYWPKNKKRFEDAAQIPLKDDKED